MIECVRCGSDASDHPHPLGNGHVLCDVCFGVEAGLTLGNDGHQPRVEVHEDDGNPD
jgi:hypothetical protein